MVDRLDPGLERITVTGAVTANAGTGTFQTSITDQSVGITLSEKDLATIQSVEKAIHDLWLLLAAVGRPKGTAGRQRSDETDGGR